MEDEQQQQSVDIPWSETAEQEQAAQKADDYRDEERIRQYDKPLEDDPVGNGIIGGLGGLGRNLATNALTGGGRFFTPLDAAKNFWELGKVPVGGSGGPAQAFTQGSGVITKTLGAIGRRFGITGNKDAEP